MTTYKEKQGEYSFSAPTDIEAEASRVEKATFETTTTIPTPENVLAATTFASLSLHHSDRIRLLDFPVEITTLIRTTLSRSWYRGIQNETTYAGSREFKLYGNPWHTCTDDAMHACRLMQHHLAALWDVGWLMSLSTDVGKRQLDMDMLIFRRQQPPPPPCEWLSIAFARGDRIRLVDAPKDLRQAMAAAVGSGLQDSRAYASMSRVWELKLYGYPWQAARAETMSARSLLLKLVSVLERFGYTVYASIEQRVTSTDDRQESDTWYCRRALDWAEGAPVYHN